jgi:hypothetical protein
MLWVYKLRCAIKEKKKGNNKLHFYNLTPAGSNQIKNKLHFFNLTPAGSHLRLGTNDDVHPSRG